MKNLRLALWYFTVPVITVVYIMIALVVGVFEAISRHLTAANEVLDTVLLRYELWAKSHEKGQLLNCPWKYTLSQVYERSLNGEI